LAKKWDVGASLLKKESVIIGKAAIVYYSAKKGVSPLHTNQEEKLLFILLNHDYFLINNDFPVISAGCSIPIISIIVGTISARHPPSRSV